MSRGFVKDGDQEEVPMVPPRKFIPPGVVNLVTKEGMQALLKEKKDLITERNSLTGNETDRRIYSNFINAKLELLEERIRTAVTPSPTEILDQIVTFGSYISIKMYNSEFVRVLRITGADESDAIKGNISYFSPMGKALLGHKTGDIVKVILPGGATVITIISISVVPPEGYLNINTSANLSSAAPTKRENNKKIAPAIEIKNNIPSEAPAKEKKPMRDNANEIFPIVNDRGIIIGRSPRWQCHNGSMLLHPVVHLLVFNQKGELYLQKRPEWKDIQPGKWDTSVGGHVSFGEKIENALRREAKEELGIEGFHPISLKQYIYESAKERELVYLYKTTYDGDINPSEELDGGRFWTMEEIKANIGKKVFTPNFESEHKFWK